MKVMQDHNNCIGCGSCVAICPKYWEMGEDGKAFLKGAKEDLATGNLELELSDPECNKDVEYSCPAQVIHLKQ